jgi:hypothetical protein
MVAWMPRLLQANGGQLSPVQILQIYAFADLRDFQIRNIQPSEDSSE